MRIKVTELALGYWQATFDGEESEAVIDRSPDQALASLVRANIRRLGVEAISYETSVEPAVSGSQGDAIFPLGIKHASERKQGG